ncbi:MAG: hypothetical protein HY749_14545 [Gammaproteobacteria bacterium]|nr:hypothetical protein [Gammaproteobacteria bacterium]MBI5618458.1 hypothetical protein [Gammaproteobacteria bacterium]
MRITNTLAFGLAAALAPVAVSALPKYVMQEISVDASTPLTVAGLNNRGQVLGYATTANPYSTIAYVTGANGQGMNLITGPGGVTASPIAINDSGQVLGFTADGSFLTGPDGQNPMPLPEPASGRFYPYAVNANGEVAGSVYPRPALGQFGEAAAVTGPNGAGLTELGTLGGWFGRAYGINASGQLAGSSNSAPSAADPVGMTQAFITDPGGANMRSIGSLAGLETEAYGINASGQIVGSSWLSDHSGMHAIMTGPNGTNLVDIGTALPGFSIGIGINASGQVVGIYDDPGSGSTAIRDFVTDANGANATLLDALIVNNPAGYVFVGWQSGIYINDLGQIAAEAVTPDGLRAFLLTPVPVPAALWLFAPALVALRRLALR